MSLKTLEEALRSYKDLEADEVFMVNTEQMAAELLSNPDYRDLIRQAMTFLDKFVIYRGPDEGLRESSRRCTEAILGACLRAGLTIGEDMNAPEMPQL